MPAISLAFAILLVLYTHRVYSRHKVNWKPTVTAGLGFAASWKRHNFNPLGFLSRDLISAMQITMVKEERLAPSIGFRAMPPHSTVFSINLVEKL